MSSLHSGITVNEGLHVTFSDARKGLYRLVVVRIEGEELTLTSSKVPAKDWEMEYDELVTPYLVDKQPCYIFYRLDCKNSLDHYQWLLLVFSPDTASSREKMLYSSSRSIVKKEFGSDYIKTEVFGTEKIDLTHDGYLEFLASKEAPNPLTEEERMIADMHKYESHVSGTQDRTSHIGGLTFRIQKQLWNELDEFLRGKCNFIEISIDTDTESIKFEQSGSKSPKELKQIFPSDSPRYYFYKFKHNYEGVSECPIIFLYYSPGYKCTIKERMLYSSSISGFLTQAKENGIETHKRLELDAGDEFSETFLIDEIHPPKIAPKNKFDKPKPPHKTKQSHDTRSKTSFQTSPEFGEFYNTNDK